MWNLVLNFYLGVGGLYTPSSSTTVNLQTVMHVVLSTGTTGSQVIVQESLHNKIQTHGLDQNPKLEKGRKLLYIT